MKYLKYLIENLDRFYKPFMVFAVCLLIGLAIANNYQRAAAVREIRNFTLVNRQMLNAHAQIQIILINAALENRKLSPVEIDTIGRLWSSAQYDQTDDIVIEGQE